MEVGKMICRTFRNIANYFGRVIDGCEIITLGDAYDFQRKLAMSGDGNPGVALSLNHKLYKIVFEKRDKHPDAIGLLTRLIEEAFKIGELKTQIK